MLNPVEHSLKTARNRESSAAYLQRSGLAFESKNNGAHLIVKHGGKTVNFWPGTGLFMADGLRGRGVRNLVAILLGNKKWKVRED